MYDKYKPSTVGLKFYKRILQVKRNTSTIAVRGDLGRVPIIQSALTASLKYYFTLNTKPVNSIVKEALEESKQLNQKGQKTWYSHIQSILKLIDSDHLLQKCMSNKNQLRLEMQKIK